MVCLRILVVQKHQEIHLIFWTRRGYQLRDENINNSYANWRQYASYLNSEEGPDLLLFVLFVICYIEQENNEVI